MICRKYPSLMTSWKFSNLNKLFPIKKIKSIEWERDDAKYARANETCDVSHCEIVVFIINR
jgi:hypothetical protein